MTIAEIMAPWATVNTALGLSGPVRDAAHYQQLLTFVDECFEHFADSEDHPMFALVDIVATRIADYEAVHHPWPGTSTPASRLEFLMEQHGLRQSDLPEIGAQSVVSEVLRGNRALNLRQVQALAKRFNVPMEAFA